MLGLMTGSVVTLLRIPSWASVNGVVKLEERPALMCNSTRKTPNVPGMGVASRTSAVTLPMAELTYDLGVVAGESAGNMKPVLYIAAPSGV